MDLISKTKKEFVDSLLKLMITPNIKQSKFSEQDEKLYNKFLHNVKSGYSDTVELPLDFAIKDELFSLIKASKVYITKAAKFKITISTDCPNDITVSEFKVKYVNNEFYYSFLDNHPGIINVDKLKDIPTDYEGFMAVPITVLEYKNLLLFNIHRVIYAPKHNGKIIYPRVVISNKYCH